jgi:hypothetical protein
MKSTRSVLRDHVSLTKQAGTCQLSKPAAQYPYTKISDTFFQNSPTQHDKSSTSPKSSANRRKHSTLSRAILPVLAFRSSRYLGCLAHCQDFAIPDFSVDLSCSCDDQKAAPRWHSATRIVSSSKAQFLSLLRLKLQQQSITMETTMQARSHELNSFIRDSTQDDAATHN